MHCRNMLREYLCRAGKKGSGKDDKPTSPNKMADKGEEIKEQAREHVESMVRPIWKRYVCYITKARSWLYDIAE